VSAIFSFGICNSHSLDLNNRYKYESLILHFVAGKGVNNSVDRGREHCHGTEKSGGFWHVPAWNLIPVGKFNLVEQFKNQTIQVRRRPGDCGGLEKLLPSLWRWE
jgi:hypothetical protein